jgi:colanic acid/amylovoran biosynthesis glycosyltransferase
MLIAGVSYHSCVLVMPLSDEWVTMIHSKSMQVALIYRNELLPRSETFILEQAASLTSFRPVFAGLIRSKAGLPLPDGSILLGQDCSMYSRSKGMVYRATGVWPGFHGRIQRAGASLVNAHFAMDGACALPVAFAAKVPLIVTLHGNDVTTSEHLHRRAIRGQLYLLRRERMFRTVKVFLCASDFLRKSALERGFPEDKLKTHYIGVDLKSFCPPTNSGPRRNVLFVGRLVEKKGCRYLIHAMQQVQVQFPLARLVIIGVGSEIASLELQAREAGIQCEFRGAQSSHVVRQELSSARVFCVPSVKAKSGDSEGLGIVFAEAQAMGVPVVSSLHGGIPEVVADGLTGLLAPERDQDRVARNIIRFFADETFWNDCSRRAVSWVADKFDLQKQTARLEEIYRDVIQSGGKSQQ